MATTTNYALRYPVLADAPNVPADLQNLATDTDGALLAVYNLLKPLYAVKSGDQSVTSSTTLVDDTHLNIAVAANTTYALDAMIMYAANSTANVKLSFTFPASTTFHWRGNGYVVGGSFTANFNVVQNAVSGVSTLSYAGGSAPSVRLAGNLIVGATAGNLRLKFAQDTSNATATTLLTGSSMRLQRVA